MQRFILIYILFCALFNVNAQQKTLLYKNYIDYYSTNAKSTILTKDLKFLKDGNYIFKGKRKDFDYIFEKVLISGIVYSYEENDFDKIYLLGEIKNSVKVGQWYILNKHKKEIHPRFKTSLNYYANGKIQFVKSKWDKFNGKYKIDNQKDYIRFTYKTEKKPNISKHENQESLTFYKKNDTVAYSKSKIVVYENNNKEIHQSSKNLNDYLKTEIVFSNSKESKNCFRPKHKVYNEYQLIIKEKFKDSKLIKISREYKYVNKGKKYFKKYINNTNFSKFLQEN